MTFHYWYWQNCLQNENKDWIGFCQKRRFWLKKNTKVRSIRSLKKKMQREGLYKEMKLRKHFEKPCLKRAREKEENIRRARKSARRNND